MTDDSLILEGGTLYATDEPRTYRGLLLPWDEVGKTNLGPLKWSKGSVRIPRDTSILMANVAHNREQVVGRFTEVLETERGLEVSVRVADTDEGDALLAEIAEGRLSKLSVEIKNVVRNGAEAISGSLFGGAFVSAGAFESASLYAELAEDIPASPVLTVDEDGDLSVISDKTPSTVTVTAEGSETPTIYTPTSDEDGNVTPTVPTSDADGNITIHSVATPSAVIVTAEDSPTPTIYTPTTETKEIEMANATAPNTLTASAASASDKGLSEVFDLISSARNGDSEANTMLAALADIKVSGTGALPAAGVLQPAWVGELWSTRRSYVRKYMPLINNGAIRAIDEKGFVLTGTDDLVKPWAGNKTELPTGTASTAVVSSVFQRWGYAADIARELFDIPGNNEVINAFISKLANSYARATDNWTREQLVAAATLVAADTYPTEYPGALGQLIQGIELVSEFDSPTFAVVNAAAWTELLYTPKDQIPEFISFGFGIGEGVANGTVRVIKGDVGIDDSPAVLVGSKSAAHVNELGGASPLLLDALDIARGGVDKAVIGYTQFLVEDPQSLVLIGTADTV